MQCFAWGCSKPRAPAFFFFSFFYWWDSFQWCMKCNRISGFINLKNLHTGWSHILLLTFSHHLFWHFFGAESDISIMILMKHAKKKVVASRFPSCGKMVKLQWRLKKQQGSSDQSALIYMAKMRLFFRCFIYIIHHDNSITFYNFIWHSGFPPQPHEQHDKGHMWHGFQIEIIICKNERIYLTLPAFNWLPPKS